MGEYSHKDVKLIAGAIKRHHKDNPEHPYAMLTGAGCSYSAGIPLANELTKEINEKFEAECAELSPEQRQDYGACMSILSTNECKALFKPHLDKAKINWGHLAIAAMMEAGFIGRVLTFNFDSILAKACGLLGIYPATYDFVSGVSSNTDFISQTAILHLHGQGHGMAMLNSTEETQKHAKNLEPLLSEIFAYHPVIVIGYSGQSDAVFNIMEDVYSGKERLYWIGRRENNRPHLNTLFAKRPGATKYIGGTDSDEFLMNLARELGCWPPKLFKNAYDHLLDELEFVGDYPESNEDLLEDLKTELVGLRDEKTKNPDKKFSAFLDKDWGTLEGLVEDPKKSSRDKELIALAKFDQAFELQSKDNPTQSELELVTKLYKEAAQLKPENHKIYNNWGNALEQLAEFTKDPKIYEESFKKYKKAVEIKDDYDLAYNNWGVALQNFAEQMKSIKIFEDSFEKYTKSIELNSESFDAHDNYGAALIRAFHLTKDKTHLIKARDILTSAKSLNPNDLYNFVCIHTLSGEFDEAKAALLHCEKKGTLPENSKHHLETDTDLDALRELDWFKDLLARLD